MVVVVSIAVGCVILILAAGVLCVFKCNKRETRNPSSTFILNDKHNRNIQQAIPGNSDEYRSLRKCSRSDSYNNQWNTTSGHIHQHHMENNEVNDIDMKCATITWPQKANHNIGQTNRQSLTNNMEYDNGNEGHKYFVLDKDFMKNEFCN